MPKRTEKRKEQLKKLQKQARRRALDSEFNDEFSAATQLALQNQWPQARQLLEKLHHEDPSEPRYLAMLIDAAHHMHDYLSCADYCRKLLVLTPDDRSVLLKKADAYLRAEHPVHAMEAFRQFVARWPNDPASEAVRKTLAKLEPISQNMMGDIGLFADDWFELGLLHEEAQIGLNMGDVPRARQAIDELLRRKPDFVPGLNNGSLIAFIEGRFDVAIAQSRQVLERMDDNVHALANLARLLFFTGKSDDVRPLVEKLKELCRRQPAGTPTQPAAIVKTVELLAILGDDEGVLSVFGQLDENPLETGERLATLYHYAAFASLRLEREPQARKLWQTASKLHPGFELARAHLEDLRKPVGQRQAPWVAPMSTLLPRAYVETLVNLAAIGPPSSTEFNARVIEYLREHPEWHQFVRVLLDRGDEVGRNLALMVASLSKTPEMLAALREFALSQRGPDAMRSQAMEVLKKASVLPDGPQRMWIKGEWRDISIHGWEIDGKALQWNYSPESFELVEQARAAMHAEDYVRAERLLRQALAREPNAPEIQNNLTACFGRQGRIEEAMAMLLETHARFPDYLFARTNLAVQRAEQGEIEAARELLAPLFKRRKMHFSEFSGLMSAQTSICLAAGDLAGARAAYKDWSMVCPEDPLLRVYERQIKEASVPWSPHRRGKAGMK